MNSVSRKCNSNVCDRASESLGWCGAHYKRFIAGKSTETPIASRRKPGQKEKCPFPNCPQFIRCNGLCQSHNAQMRDKGVLSTVLTQGEIKRPKCTVDGCELGIKSRKDVCARHSKTLRTYRITVEEYNEFLRAGCSICKSKESLVVDHDHNCCSRETTGRHTCGKCVRGVLCDSCNRGLGLLGDQVEDLERALNYLRRCARIDTA